MLGKWGRSIEHPDTGQLSVTSVGFGLDPKAQSTQTAQKQSESERINQDECKSKLFFFVLACW
jgi:hypothetical protein